MENPVNNFNGPWYIHKEYAASYLPLIHRFLKGTLSEKKGKKTATPLKKHELNTSEASGSSSKFIAVFSIKHAICKYDVRWAGITGSTTIIRNLDQLENDDSIIGVVFDIDSGGGQAYGTPLLYDAIKTFSKPTVSFTDGFMCSAAYYLGSAADAVVVSPRAEAIGSIGAYTSILDFTGMFEKLGAKEHTVYATKSTDKNYAYRELLKGNYEPYIKEELDPLVEDFHKDMRAARPGLKEEVFAGGTWGGNKAVEMGLADEVGSLEDAVNKAFSLANETNTNLSLTQNTKVMSKNRPLLQAALGIDSPFEAVDGHSSLSEEMLDTLESQLASQAQAVTDAEAARDTAQTALTDAKTNFGAVSTELDALIKKNEVEVDANATEAEKLTALQSHITALGQQDGATHTRVGSDGKPITETNKGYMDANASHNLIADELNLN